MEGGVWRAANQEKGELASGMAQVMVTRQQSQWSFSLSKTGEERQV